MADGVSRYTLRGIGAEIISYNFGPRQAPGPRPYTALGYKDLTVDRDLKL